MSKNKERERQLKSLMDWVESRIAEKDVPRLQDVAEYAHKVLGFTELSTKIINKATRLLPAYLLNSPQQRKRLRTGKYRPITISSLGNLHCDLGFFAVERGYETPSKYRAGFFVAKDVVSRYLYVRILRKNRKAPSIITAFTEIFAAYEKRNPGHRVESVSFDKEPSVLSHSVQQFLHDRHVSFHAFENTASKSKFAESAIRYDDVFLN